MKESKPEIDEFEDHDFSPTERKRLRRILRDDSYARHFRTTLKVWTITLGTVMSLFIAGKTIWDLIIARFVK